MSQLVDVPGDLMVEPADGVDAAVKLVDHAGEVRFRVQLCPSECAVLIDMLKPYALSHLRGRVEEVSRRGREIFADPSTITRTSGRSG